MCTLTFGEEEWVKKKAKEKRESLQTSIIPIVMIPTLSLPQPLRLDCPSQATTPFVVIFPVLVPDLPTRLAATVLSSFLETRVQVRPDNALIQLAAPDIFHAVQRVLMGIVLHEAEAAGGLVEPVEAHHQALDLAALGEELVDLLFGCVKGAILFVQVSWGFWLLMIQNQR